MHKQFSKSARKLYRRFDVRKPERSILAAKFGCSSNSDCGNRTAMNKTRSQQFNLSEAGT